MHKKKDAYLALGRNKLTAKMKEQFAKFHVSRHVKLWLEASISVQL